MCKPITAHSLMFASDRMTALLIALFHKLKPSLLHVLTIYMYGLLDPSSLHSVPYSRHKCTSSEVVMDR